MLKSIKILSTAGLAAMAFASASSAETVWKPPAEIAGKGTAESGAAPAAAETAAPATPSAPVAKADKEKGCNEQAAAKGLKGKAKRQFKAECLKS
ncbi:PsiF family protein [Methylocystis parvus]|nr:PsiF family protein [Methylocystis parvus]WBJ99729.1 PsiF family protein [Methylocystis parvus OBBP]